MLKIAFSPIYAHPLPQSHRFPMEKYDLLPKQLIYEGTVTQENFFEPIPISEEKILRVHTSEYWNKLKTVSISHKEERLIGFPISKRLIQREITIAGGTIQNTEFALKYGVSMNIAGGTHHAFTEHGEGFCLINDQAVAACHLIDEYNFDKILIVDLDVHQGNGTAEIFQNESRVFTFSMHGEKNYPHKKEKSDLDIELKDKTDDKTYLQLLKETLPQIITEQKPQFIFFQSGVDVLETDKLGRLAMTLQGCKERDNFVFQECKNNNIPLCVSMGGGYSPKIADIVEAHANTFRLVQQIYF